MKKLILFLMVTLASLSLISAQKKTALPKFGELVSDTLTNKGTAAATFYFQYCAIDAKGKCDETTSDIFKSDSVFKAWLLKQAESKNADERRLQYAVALARLMKNTLAGSNRLANLTGEKATDVQTVLLSPVVAFLSNGLAPTVEFFLNTLASLQDVDTACLAGNFRTIMLPYYSLAEIKYKNGWVAIDANAESYALLFEKSNSGYYSLSELNKDTALILPAIKKYGYNYTNTAGELLANWTDVPGNYPMYFISPKLESKTLSYQEATPVSAEVILPAGAQLVFTYVNDAVNVDTSTGKGKKVFAELLILYNEYNQKEDENLMKQIVRLLVGYEGITEEQAATALTSGKVLVQGNKTGFRMNPFYSAAPYHAVVEMIVPPHEDLWVLGFHVGAPFLWLGEKKSLWQANEPRAVEAADVKLFSKGTVGASTTAQHYTLAINTNLINQFNGFNIKPVKNADKLVVTRKAFKLKD